MPVETDADRAIFLDLDAFGVEGVYTARRNGEPTPVIGIFDEASKTFDPARWMGGPDYAQQQGAQFSGTAPTFLCRTSDLPDNGKQGSTLFVNGKKHLVHDPKPDGTGLIVLILMED